MPELPEVESIRLSLLPTVIGRLISRVEVLTPGILICDRLAPEGWQIADLRRRGKYLIFDLSASGPEQSRNAVNRTAESGDLDGLGSLGGLGDLDGLGGLPAARLIVHLRMTGQLLLQTSELPPEKHTHIRLTLQPASGGPPIWLVFHDTRRFGRIWLLPQGSALEPAGLAAMGPEPLDLDFTAAVLTKQLATHRKQNLKAALLDQSVVAGLGNIYADEVLFASGLAPARPAGGLSAEENGRLAEAIRSVLIKAVDCAGTTLRDYVNGWNQEGRFQECLMVYGRAGQACRSCGASLACVRLAGRTTVWCPSCQPEHPD